MGSFIDITGRRFGKLTVLYRNNHNKGRNVSWHCLCDCGKEKDVVGAKLKNGNTKSCGCYHIEKTKERQADYTGIKFGRLTVIRLNKITPRRGRQWECACDCGNHSFVYSNSLRSGKITSCGCRKKEVTHNLFFRDITGMIFGRLTVVGCVGKNNLGQIVWKCKCSCGKDHLTIRNALINKKTTSCGCYQIDKMTKHGLSRTKEYMRMSSRKTSKTRRDRAMELDKFWTPEMEVALSRFFPKCVVCGGTNRMASDHVLPLSRGYGLTPGNAVRLCINCNSRKRDSMPDKMNAKFAKEDWDKVLSSARKFSDHWSSILTI